MVQVTCEVMKLGLVNRFKTGNPFMGTLENHGDPDEEPHGAAFHQGLHCLLRQN